LFSAYSYSKVLGDAFCEAVSKNCEKFGKVSIILLGCENSLAVLLHTFAYQRSGLVEHPGQAVSSDKMSAIMRRLSGSCIETYMF
jgi:hypothetical protein